MSDPVYHDRRSAEERRFAEDAQTPAARDIHNQLAHQHADRAALLRRNVPPAL